ncbi:MAG: hypothetical protein KFF49_08615 [Bacteroidales bacterium]|nr:hypothetical protein [Bacteroidales bacterium]
MKKFLTIILTLISLNLSAQKIISAGGIKLSLDEQLRITSIYGNREYLPGNTESYIVRLKAGDRIMLPEKTIWKANIAEVFYDMDIRLVLRFTEMDAYLKIEIMEVSDEDRIDVLFYGPFSSTIDETIGEIVGLVREEGYALGLQSLNAKTTGGKLSSPDGSDPARGTTATAEDHGSSLQAYCINRAKDRTYNIWNKSIPDAFIPANEDGKLEGSAIALFGCPEEEVLRIIEQIELEQGLPYSTVNGRWSKTSPDANKPYLICTFTEENIDEIIEYTKKLGYNAFYHSHPFSTWGHFYLLVEQFPNGWDGMKECVDKARKEGLRAGIHTLTNFITTNDPFVTPVPDENLMVFSKTTISRDLSEEGDEIYISDPEGYDYKNTNQALLIGEEIIRFSGVSEDEPYSLLDCRRGQYGTKPSSYSSGTEIARLVDHPYKVFFPNWELQKEMISNLAGFLNYTGLGQLDFDGHEGGWGTGEGEFGMDYFSEQLQKKVGHELRNGSSRSNHYYWHTVSYINWGEPWYGGFTKSQGHYRYRNQALLKRNYIPNMLGWFMLTESTSLQEFEYMLARSAGYDAGYALYSMLDDMKKNPEFDEIAEAINNWEEARLRKVFNDKQLVQLQDVDNDFSLGKINEDEFELQYYDKKKFELLNLPVQPGQPNDVSIDFEVDEEQAFYIVIGAVGESGEISRVTIDFNGYDTYTFELDLEPNWAITYRGDDTVLVYDELGRLNRKIPFVEEKLILREGPNNIRVSADFSSGADIKLQGYVRLKGRKELLNR